MTDRPLDPDELGRQAVQHVCSTRRGPRSTRPPECRAQPALANLDILEREPGVFVKDRIADASVLGRCLPNSLYFES